MKKTNLILILAFTLFALISTSCKITNTSELTEDQKNSVSKEVETVVRNFLKDISYKSEVAIRANVDGYLFAGDGKITFTNYPSFEKYVKEAFKDIEKFTEVEVPALHVYVLSKDAASCTFELKGKYLTNKGDTLVNNACWTMVLKKFDNGWKAVQENGTHTK